MSYLLNPFTGSNPHRDPRLSLSSVEDVRSVVSTVFDYSPTPLVSLSSLARKLNLAELAVKDEGSRLGLKSFKALGGAYAVFRLALEQAGKRSGRSISINELPCSPTGSLDSSTQPLEAGSAAFQAVAREMVFACATDGNHGQSVAAGASLIGARSIIFVHEGVTQARRDAIARFGAEIRVISGSYDDAVSECAKASLAQGWTLLSDTTWPGYEDVPRWVMQGYTLISAEVCEQLSAPPTHVFLQAGVGGFAAALCSSMFEAWGPATKFIVVEPERAACLLASARAGKPIAVAPQEPTLMSMLECYEPSLLAWKVLTPIVHSFMTVNEDEAIGAMQQLALPEEGDVAILAGESGSAGMAALLSAFADPELTSALGLSQSSRVLVINTESATDEARYEELVGVPASTVRENARRSFART
ncbi:diaminopropionate ammonia-lyase [Ottowia thiooxydans]|uniref:diaminopropionate ammonia-lyase n=1 Tax=Ottowia thiooxydans TaxID=219182 RepID=UPI003396DB9E